MGHSQPAIAPGERSACYCVRCNRWEGGKWIDGQWICFKCLKEMGEPCHWCKTIRSGQWRDGYWICFTCWPEGGGKKNKYKPSQPFKSHYTNPRKKKKKNKENQGLKKITYFKVVITDISNGKL